MKTDEHRLGPSDRDVIMNMGTSPDVSEDISMP